MPTKSDATGKNPLSPGRSHSSSWRSWLGRCTSFFAPFRSAVPLALPGSRIPPGAEKSTGNFCKLYGSRSARRRPRSVQLFHPPLFRSPSEDSVPVSTDDEATAEGEGTVSVSPGGTEAGAVGVGKIFGFFLPSSPDSSPEPRAAESAQPMSVGSHAGSLPAGVPAGLVSGGPVSARTNGEVAEVIDLDAEATAKGKIASIKKEEGENIAIDNASLKDLGGLKQAMKPGEAELAQPLVTEKEQGILGSLLLSFFRKKQTEGTEKGAAPAGLPAVSPAASAPKIPLASGVSKNDRDTTPKPTLTAEQLKEEAERSRIQQIKDEEERRKAEEARKKEEQKQKLSKAQTTVISAAAPKVQKPRSSGWQEFIGGIKYFGLGKERLTIIQNLATMLNAGLPLVDSIKTLQMEARTKPIKKLLQNIVDAVENGSALWRAMEDQHFFSPHAIALIRIGEEAGNLAENMQYLSLQQEKDQELRSKVKQAMIYPIIVLVLMFIIVMGLGLFVLPNLIQVLFSLNVKLPLVTRLVIMFTNAFSSHAATGVPSFIGGFFFLMILGKYTRFRVVVQWILFRIPGVGRLAKEATLARFGVILGGLLEAGVPLVEALRSLVEVTSFVSYRRFYSRLLEHVNVGDSFAKSFAIIQGSQKILPISVQQLVITGERTGSLAKIMLKIADIYEKKANDTAQKLPVILEPMLLLFIGALVGTIAFAIIVPIYSIVGTVGH